MSEPADKRVNVTLRGEEFSKLLAESTLEGIKPGTLIRALLRKRYGLTRKTLKEGTGRKA